jgi:D-alanyl-lipoteichoic acid acyltransferase DltB (MBOAT superfamily)
VAGPIIRASYFIPQLDEKPSRTASWRIGLLLIVWGLFKKAIIANYLSRGNGGPGVFRPIAYHAVDLLLALYGYSVQLFCDFSAYSDIATGVAALLGYRFPGLQSPCDPKLWPNSGGAGNLPVHLAARLFSSPSRQTQRAWKTRRNLFITMFLGGIWHGAMDHIIGA